VDATGNPSQGYTAQVDSISAVSWMKELNYLGI